MALGLTSPVDDSREKRLADYEQRTGGLVTALAVAFIAVYAVPILWPDGPPALLSTFHLANLAIWAVFVGDLCFRVVLAPRRWRYLATHPLDVATVAMPMLRPLRVLRVFVVGQALFSRGAGLTVLRTVQYVVVTAATLLFISSLAMLDAERGADGATIRGFGDALWWSATTITTVGYGDTYPVTSTGRLVAIALMFVGISLLGVITATIAAWFVARTRDAVQDEGDLLDARIARLEAGLAEILALLRPASPPVEVGGSHPAAD
jgi:voltage-gated potassium channel